MKARRQVKVSLPEINIGETSVPGDIPVKFSYDISLIDAMTVTCYCKEAGMATIFFIRPPIREVNDNDWILPSVGLSLNRRANGLHSWDLEAMERFIHVVNKVYDKLHQLWVLHGPAQLPIAIEQHLEGIIDGINIE